MALASKGVWRERVDQVWGSGLPACFPSSAGMVWVSMERGAAPLVLRALAPEKERGALADWTKPFLAV